MPPERVRHDTRAVHAALLELKRVYQFRDRDRICCHDISVSQCWALESLQRRGPLTLNELAGELYVEKSTASRVVAGLERKGHVARVPHPEDGRALLIEVTDVGRELYSRIEADMLAEEGRLLAEFAPEVRRAMAELIGRLAEAAASRVEVGGGKCCVVD